GPPVRLWQLLAALFGDVPGPGGDRVAGGGETRGGGRVAEHRRFVAVPARAAAAVAHESGGGVVRVGDDVCGGGEPLGGPVGAALAGVRGAVDGPLAGHALGQRGSLGVVGIGWSQVSQIRYVA